MFRVNALRDSGGKQLRFSEGVFLQTGTYSTGFGYVSWLKRSRSQHVLTLSLEEQDTEELFDLSLISALEIDIIPYVGDERVPDYIILQLAKMLRQGSLLHQTFDEALGDGSISRSHSTTSSESSVSTKIDSYSGTTVNSAVVPRERFSYWCLDLLFLVCSNTDKGADIRIYTCHILLT